MPILGNGNMMSGIKLELIYHTTAREGPATAASNMHKNFGKDGTYTSGDMLTDRQTNTHTDRRTHHNTPLLTESKCKDCWHTSEKLTNDCMETHRLAKCQK